MAINFKLALAGVIGGVALTAAAVTGVHFYGNARYRAGMEKCQADHRTAELEAFKAEAGKLAEISTRLQQASTTLATAKPKIIERYTHETTIKPLPADCLLDAGRLRGINAAIDAANAAGEPGAAVPAARAPGN